MAPVLPGKWSLTEPPKRRLQLADELFQGRLVSHSAFTSDIIDTMISSNEELQSQKKDALQDMEDAVIAPPPQFSYAGGKLKVPSVRLFPATFRNARDIS
jgi:hypothetical protein